VTRGLGEDLVTPAGVDPPQQLEIEAVGIRTGFLTVGICLVMLPICGTIGLRMVPLT